MPKILIIDSCDDCCHCVLRNYAIREGACYLVNFVKTKKKILNIEEIPDWCPLEEEDNKLRAKWFKKGQMSVKRKNKSGCTCIIDEDLGDKVVSVCGAHEAWMEEKDGNGN